MAEFVTRPDTGSAFKNLKKASDTHADYTGTALVGGVEYWLNTYVKRDKNGNPWFSHTFKPKGEKKDYPAKPKPVPAEDDDSGVPF